MTRWSSVVLCAMVAMTSLSVGAAPLRGAELTGTQDAATRSGREIYDSTCSACHGPAGKGTANPALTQVITLPDFSDCSFARREADGDWLAVAHEGGAARGFSPLMPPWKGTFSAEELTRAIAHMRTFCADERWPRGELNLPRPLITGKAFPEDELVVSTSASTRGEGAIVSRFIYERRFGPVDQLEVAVPLVSAEGNSGRWATGVGDVALGYKRALMHDLHRGQIFSLSAEATLPVGSQRRGLGKGFAVFEPFATFAQLLPGAGFVQAQAGFEIPLDDDGENEAFWRAAFGRSLQHGRFGRTWSPMVEILAGRALETGAVTRWDVVPQMQVTLNRRQHVRVNGGVRLPLNDRRDRSPTAIVYLLWDWFDGGFLDGW